MKDKIESQHILVIYFRVIFYLVPVLTCKILLLIATNHNFIELQILFQIKAPLIFDNISQHLCFSSQMQEMRSKVFLTDLQVLGIPGYLMRHIFPSQPFLSVFFRFYICVLNFDMVQSRCFCLLSSNGKYQKDYPNLW